MKKHHPKLLIGPIVIEAPQRARPRPSARRPAPRTIDVQARRIDVEEAPDPASDPASDRATIDWIDVALKVCIFFLGGWLYLFVAHGKPMQKH